MSGIKKIVSSEELAKIKESASITRLEGLLSKMNVTISSLGDNKQVEKLLELNNAILNKIATKPEKESDSCDKDILAALKKNTEAILLLSDKNTDALKELKRSLDLIKEESAKEVKVTFKRSITGSIEEGTFKKQ